MLDAELFCCCVIEIFYTQKAVVSQFNLLHRTKQKNHRQKRQRKLTNQYTQMNIYYSFRHCVINICYLAT